MAKLQIIVQSEEQRSSFRNYSCHLPMNGSMTGKIWLRRSVERSQRWLLRITFRQNEGYFSEDGAQVVSTSWKPPLFAMSRDKKCSPFLRSRAQGSPHADIVRRAICVKIRRKTRKFISMFTRCYPETDTVFYAKQTQNSSKVKGQWKAYDEGTWETHQQSIDRIIKQRQSVFRRPVIQAGTGYVF